MEHSLTKERPVHTWPVGSMGARDQREPAVGVGAVSRGVPVTGDPGDSSVLLPGGSLRGLLCSALHTAQVRSGAGVYPLQGSRCSPTSVVAHPAFPYRNEFTDVIFEDLLFGLLGLKFFIIIKDTERELNRKIFIVMVIRHEAQMPVFFSSVCELIVVPRKVPLELFMNLKIIFLNLCGIIKSPKYLRQL